MFIFTIPFSQKTTPKHNLKTVLRNKEQLLLNWIFWQGTTAVGRFEGETVDWGQSTKWSWFLSVHQWGTAF